MSRKFPSENLKQKIGDVPMHTTTRVLGVSIGVPQVHHRCDMLGVDYPMGGSPDVKIQAVGDRRWIDSRDRRYIAAWARRNLFNGAGPK